ncbi:MAG: class I SAM-dependent RNA methyltransferase [Anaerolineales bacterium]
MSILQLTLTESAYGGSSLARLPDGHTVFVPFALPGESVRIRLIPAERPPLRADLLEILQQAPQRIPAVCPHFTICGNCAYQHLPYPNQLELKTHLLRDQLQRVARLPNPPTLPAIPAPQAYAYRTHAEFSLTAEGQPAYRSHHGESFTPQTCPILHPDLAALYPQLDLESIPDLHNIELRLGTEGTPLLILHGSDPQAPEFGVDIPLSAVYLHPHGSILLAGYDHTLHEIHARPFRVSAGAPYPTSLPETVLETLLQNIPPHSHLLHLYSGSGILSALLAQNASHLTAIEENPYAAFDFEVNLDEFDNVDLYEAPAELALPEVRRVPQAALLQPAGAGVSRGDLENLLALKIPTLAYLSTNAASLARDARQLARAGYSLVTLLPFDAEPQSAHIHSLSVWKT